MTRRMHLCAIGVLACLLAGGCSTGGPAMGDRFENGRIGAPPPGFVSAASGTGPAGVWVVREDASSPAGSHVLAQVDPDPTRNRFPLCIAEGFSAADVEVSVRFKAVSGAVDQGAGLVVRYQDKDHYYVARANSLENNVRFYKMVKGERIKLANADRTIPAGQWHELRMQAAGSRFRVWLSGELVIEAEDSAITQAGGVGLWTKADSVTQFDDFAARAVGR